MVRRKRSREAGTSAAGIEEAPVTGVPLGRSDVTTEAAARALAHRLLTPGRGWPVVVVTIASGAPEPYADVDVLVEDLRGLAEVVVMPTSDVSWAFSSQMPAQTQVYGGASRVYPVEHRWVAAPRTAPLRFAYSLGERASVTGQLLGDAMAAAVAAGTYRPQTATTSLPAVTGTVAVVIGNRAVIQLNDGGMGALWEELTGFDVPLSRLVAKGQRVRGRLDPETRRLDLDVARAPMQEAPGLPTSYTAGAAVLVKVTGIDASSLTLRMVPGIDVVTPASQVTTNGLDSLETLFSLEDVVVARLTAVSPPELSLLDVDDDEPTLVAPALLEGGPPWLEAPVPPEVVLSDDVAAVDVLVDGTPAEVGGAVGPPDSTTSTVEPVPARRTPTPSDAWTGRSTPMAAGGPTTTPQGRGPGEDVGRAISAVHAENVELRRRLDLSVGAPRELEALRQHTEQLERTLAAAVRNERAYRDKYRQADRRRQKLEREAKAAAARGGVDDDARDWFADPVDALRFSVTEAWARRTPSGEKGARPLREWSAGKSFATSLDNLGTVTWRKLAEVVADVVVGDPGRLRALEHHELRQSVGGNSPAVTRGDGAVCWRVALQRNTPSARRLHFWRRGDFIELSRVVLHDDATP